MDRLTVLWNAVRGYGLDQIAGDALRSYAPAPLSHKQYWAIRGAGHYWSVTNKRYYSAADALSARGVPLSLAIRAEPVHPFRGIDRMLDRCEAVPASTRLASAMALTRGLDNQLSGFQRMVSSVQRTLGYLEEIREDPFAIAADLDRARNLAAPDNDRPSTHVDISYILAAALFATDKRVRRKFTKTLESSLEQEIRKDGYVGSNSMFVKPLQSHIYIRVFVETIKEIEYSDTRQAFLDFLDQDATASVAERFAYAAYTLGTASQTLCTKDTDELRAAQNLYRLGVAAVTTAVLQRAEEQAPATDPT